MSAGPPDMTGYPLEEAREALSAAGCDGVELRWVGRKDASGERRAMVIRQRSTESGGVELTVATEWRIPMRKDST